MARPDKIERVRVQFEIAGVSERLVVRGGSLEEAMSDCYELSLEVQHPVDAVDDEAIMGADATLTLERGKLRREVRGVIVNLARSTPRTIRLTVAPAFALLQHRVASRIFEGKSIPDVLEAVVGAALKEGKRKLELQLDGTYDPREYIVQYQESDFEFAMRLMAEVGITFVFDHSDDTETMVLYDRVSSQPELESYEGKSCRFHRRQSQMAGPERVSGFERARGMTSTGIEIVDDDWTNPSLSLSGSAKCSDAPSKPFAREVKLYQRDCHSGDYKKPKYEKHTVSAQAKLRSEEEGVGGVVCSGSSTVLGLAAGARFELENHPMDDLNGEYVALSAIHEFGDHDYGNRFTAILESVPFRPARATERPRVHGLQTATVIGPAGEEIHTDEHGRIQVRFPWSGSQTSCWIRTMQPWAGQGFGAVVIPRIGMEVVVSFLDGDVDRPLVTGCVYNGTNTPPHELPANKTQSTFKTRSSPGGDGFNEWRFEDRAGAEEVYLHAQRDHNEVVRRNHTRDVGNDETIKVHKNQSLTVDVDRTKHIGKNETTMVKGTRTETVMLAESVNVLGARTHQVGLADLHNVGGLRSLNVGMAYTEVVGFAHSVWIGRSETVTIGGNKTDSIGKTYGISVKTGDYKVRAHSTSFSFQKAGASLVCGKNNVIKIHAGKEIQLVTGKASIVLKKDGEIAISGTKITVNGETSVTAVGGKKAKAVLDKNAITMSAPKASIKAKGDVIIKGSKVKEN